MAQWKAQNEALRRQMRSLATCLALVACVGTSFRCLQVEAYSKLLFRLVFPSGDVTVSKMLWLGLGMGLAFVQLKDVVDRCRQKWTTRGQQMFLVDESSRSASVLVLSSVNKLQRVPVNTQQFQGQMVLETSVNSFGLQLQGRFMSHVPVNSELFLALELLTEVKGLKWTVIEQFCKLCGVQTVRGQDQKSLGQLRFSVPLTLCEDLLFGSKDGEEKQANNFTQEKIYTLEANSSGWKLKWLVTSILTMLEWIPSGWTMPPMRLTGYLQVPKRGVQVNTMEKRNLFCFSMHYDGPPTHSDSKPLRISLPRIDLVPELDVGSPIALFGGNGQRGGVPLAHAEACRRIGEDSRALNRLNFSLDVWVEFVDRVAGRRKVGYLLEVTDKTQQLRRTVMRSATTLKNALLLLHLEHQIDRKETERETGKFETEIEPEQAEPVDFQTLTVESREYRYGQIEHETSAVAQVLEQIASTPAQGRRRWRQPQRCYQNQLEKATLYRCLMSPSRLPSVPSYHAIGVQLNESQHLAMNVVSEAGVYRLHGAGDGTRPLLRQEWFIVAADNLHFFRSFSVAPSLSIPVTSVLNVSSIDHLDLLNGNKPANVYHAKGAVPRWYCLEIHLVLEVITVFVETPEEREQLVASLQPLTIDGCDGHVPSIPVKEEAVAVAPLFSPMTLDTQTQPVCLNQRTSRFVDGFETDINASMAQNLVQESLEAGLKVFALSEVAVRLRINRPTVLRFLDKVEKLNNLDLDKVSAGMSSRDRVALGLNLYHTLFIHAVLIFRYPQSHEQWKLLQTIPCYLMRVKGGNESVRYTLADIQRVILRCPVPVSLEASSFKRSLSQNALMDLAIGGGDAIDGLSRTVLGVAWTPVLPSSSSYSAVKTTPRPVPAGLAIDNADIRTCMVLQVNSSPPAVKTTGVIRVYDGGRKLNDQLDATCTIFLSRELELDEVSRVIKLPRVCEWYRIGHRDEGDEQNDGVNRRMDSMSQRSRRRSSSGSAGLAALPRSRGFYCLQRVLDFMEVEQHHRAMHLLLGAGEECRFVFNEFWTRPSRSTAANLLTSAGNAALSVFSSNTIHREERGMAENGSDWSLPPLRSFF
ncbi:hypothetical protein P3T76_013247 [Phytophthora citrophthora]|uniref:DUF547 domain-containing protein n=1 Tax=Phytophthora citrophthora TaxID=4793 RepID=A0AAD9LC04_9STRA|nr:hypothetical protein P3T76_013247 [Phytophthora citrophthora]